MRIVNCLGCSRGERVDLRLDFGGSHSVLNVDCLVLGLSGHPNPSGRDELQGDVRVNFAI